MHTPIPMNISFFLKHQDPQGVSRRAQKGPKVPQKGPKTPLKVGGPKLIHNLSELVGEVSLSSLGLAGPLQAYLKPGL